MKRGEMIAAIASALSLGVIVFAALSLFAGTKSLPVELADINCEEPSAEDPGEPVSSPNGAVKIESFTMKVPPYIKMIPGGTYYTNAEVTPANANEVLTWHSSNSSVATVSKDGVITAERTGFSMITVSAFNNLGYSRILVDVVRVPDTILDVPYITQIYDYPNGCEAVSTVMALNYEGIDITVDDFIENYLDMSPLPAVLDGELWGYSPWDYFLGDPRNPDGLCCYAPCIVHSLEKFVDPEKYEIIELYGEDIEDLCTDYVMKGDPVIFWGTMYMNAPSVPGWHWRVIDTDDTYYWVDPMHCLLLVGVDKDNYYFNDPTAGKCVPYAKSDVRAAYEGLFEQAVVVRRRDNPETADENEIAP